MNFPTRFMRLTELTAMGLPKTLLRRAYGDRGQRFAMKIHPEKTNSPIVFDTDGLAKWLERDIAAQVAGMERR